jgi:prolyl 4-hydroxylase
MHFLTVIDNILTPEECKLFIEFIDKEKEIKKINRGAYGSYSRITWNNKAYADEIFNRIKKYLPKDKNYKCCNQYFRLAKYDIGGEFKIHKDGTNQDNEGNRSHLTLNIFLNDDFEGGETDFFNDDKSFRYSASPRAGRGALFYSQQYHCGNVVKSGNKYLLRTDVMI